MHKTTRSIRREDLLKALMEATPDASARTSKVAVAPKPGVSRLWVAAVAVLIVAAAAIVLPSLNMVPRAAAEETTVTPPTERSVSVVRPQSDAKTSELLLPAEVLAYQTTAIHARIGGYLKVWHVDRGARVTAGQTLAEIDAPEFDQELLRARSELEEGKALLAQSKTERDQAIANLAATKANVLKADANLGLAVITRERYKNLEEAMAASRQQYDETVRNQQSAEAEVTAAKANVGSFEAAVASREAAIRTAEARVNSLAANVRRLEETESFKKLVAPFDGVITRRWMDVGALVSKDGTHEIFTLAQDDKLRITVNVPQSYAALIREGQNAEIVAREFAQKNFAAKVARSAGAIDTAARTLAVELELNNADRKLLPGAFTQVRFLLQDSNPVIQVPASTLRFTKDGPQVVAVNASEKLETLQVKLGRDFGANVEVVSGLHGDERLVVNPSDSMTPGERVRIEEKVQDKVAAK